MGKGSLKNVRLHSVEMDRAVLSAVDDLPFPPSVVKKVRGGIYYKSSYWFEDNESLTWSGVIGYRKLRRVLKKK